MDNSLITRAADNIRILSAAMVEKAKSGHPGGAMGGADFINILYDEFLNIDPSDPYWHFRDRFFLDPGHMSPMMYSILTLMGYYSLDDLRDFRQWGSNTPGHPELDIAHGIENTSGPLGVGHTMAVGSAIAERFFADRFGEWAAHKTYTFISDGGIQEEISQGAGRIAGFLGLHNLIMFYDSNDIQLSTETDEVTCEDTAKKYEAWGWNVITIDGNDPEQIRGALKAAIAEEARPTLIIGKTIMGKGIRLEDGGSFEGQVSTHGQSITNAGASIGKTVENLGGNPEDPFTIFHDVATHFEAVIKKKISYASEQKAKQQDWASKHPELDEKLEQFLSGSVEDFDFDSIEMKSDAPTRGSSATMLQHFAEKIENMIVMSADLANSDKTDGFLKGGSLPFSKHNFSGGFLHAGVAELTMAAIANGIALHGGIFVACGTFFVFSDFMKPAIRLAALMELPVKYIWTHDAFRVGEDGPTHQPVEHEAQIRLLEKLKNHSGNSSMLVLRPADALETRKAWQMAMENSSTPTALILSRQNVKDIPDLNGVTREEQVQDATKGAYTVVSYSTDPDLILVGNGSEVYSLVEVARCLNEEKKIGANVVSVISEGLFRQQDKDYQKQVLPADKPIFGLTAGLPVNLEGLVGSQGYVFGMDHFGYSAPAAVLDEKFGFTIDQVYAKVVEFLEK